MKLSKEQKIAIKVENKNTLVSASAGSGKTFVLTRRVIDRILNKGWSIDDFLILTFTNDAAGEMKNRIYRGIEEEINSLIEKDGDESLIKHLENQLILTSNANISTIDSFCSKVVKENFNKTPLDTGYKIPSKVEANLMKNEAFDTAMDKVLSRNDENINRYYKKYITKKDNNKIKNIIFRLFEFVDSLPYPFKWLDEVLEEYQKDYFYETKWYSDVFEKMNFALENSKEYLDGILDIVRFNEKPGFVDKICEYLIEIEDLLKRREVKGLAEITPSFIIKVSKLEKDEEENVKIYAGFIKENLKFIVEMAKKMIFFGEVLFEENKKDIYAVVEIEKEFINCYKKLKFENQFAEFNDISHLVLEIFRDENGKLTDIAKGYKEKLKEIIIDEYQDSNHLQEEILTAISKDGKNMFMVGDIKQAIYRFRQATPQLFLEKLFRNQKIDLGENLEDVKSDEVLVLLRDNYRSRNNVLETCNFIFSKIMDIKLGEVDYDENAKLNFKASYKECDDEEKSVNEKSEILFVEVEKGQDKNEAEAKLVAKRIYDMLKKEKLHIFDKDINNYRKVECGDIVILVSTKGKVKHIKKELDKLNINCVYNADSSLFESNEVRKIISLLKVINNPYDDVELISVLNSPMFNLNLNEISYVRMLNRNVSVYSSFKNYLEGFEGNKNKKTYEKIKTFFEALVYFREFFNNNSIGNLIDEIYLKTGFYNYVGTKENGEFRQANLMYFKELIEQRESYGVCDLSSILEGIDVELEGEIEESQKTSTASIFSGKEEVINIKTIHSSKGLEYPVVFLCNTGNSKNVKYKSEDFIFSRELGIGLKYLDRELGVKYKTPIYDIILKDFEGAEISERLRLLYVALTRAREKLIVTGAFEKSEKKFIFTHNKNQFLPYDLRYNCNSFLENIRASFLGQKNFENDYFIYKEIPYEKIESGEKEQFESAISLIEKINKLENRKFTGNYDDIIEESFNFKYKNEDLTKLPAKISITEIKRKLNNQNSENEVNYYSELKFRDIEFGGKENISANQVGIAYHSIMERFDYEKIKSIEDVKNFLYILESKGILSEDELKEVNLNKLEMFLKSELYERIKKAELMFREVPFVMSISSQRLKEFEKVEGEIVVHGIIDLYFVEKGKIVLVDYKSDRVGKRLEILKNRYKVQIDLYKEALEKATGMEVAEGLIYSIDKGVCINV